MPWDSVNSGEAFLSPADHGSIFPVVKMFVKSCQDVWGSGSWLMRGQVNTEDETKFPSPVRSTSEAWIVWRAWWWWRVGPFWLVLAIGVAVFNASHRFAEHASHGFAGIQKAVVDQTNSRAPNSDCGLFFGASLALRSALKLLFSPATELVVACCIESTFHHISQSDWEMVCCCVEQEKTTLQNDIFLVSVSLWGTHLLSFFTFSIYFKCWTTREQSVMSSLATSCVVVRGSALMMFSVGHCQLPMAGHYTLHLQGSCLLCKTSWTTAALYVL